MSGELAKIVNKAEIGLALCDTRMLDELVAWSQHEVRGEVTLVVEGAVAVVPDLEGAAAQVLERVRGGTRLKPAVAAVAAESGLAKNALYELALKLQTQSP